MIYFTSGSNGSQGATGIQGTLGTSGTQGALGSQGSTAGTATNLSGGVLTNYGETVNVVGNTSTAATINLANGNFVTATLTGNCTFTFTTGLTSGAVSFTLLLTNDATAGRSITWPASVVWPGGVVPTRTTTASKSDIWTFFTLNNGTKWYGIISIVNYS
jgi:hypothetical protein